MIDAEHGDGAEIHAEGEMRGHVVERGGGGGEAEGHQHALDPLRRPEQPESGIMSIMMKPPPASASPALTAG